MMTSRFSVLTSLHHTIMYSTPPFFFLTLEWLCWFCKVDTGFIPIFVYAIFGSSRQLAIGPVALVSLLVSNVLGGIVNSSDELYTELAILLAFMVGILECMMALLRYYVQCISYKISFAF